MNEVVALRVALVLQLISLCASLSIGSAFESHLPEQLQQYLALELERESTSIELYALFAGLPLVVAYFISAVGLFFLKKWAKWIYICSGILMYPLTVFSAPTVEHSLATVIGEFEPLSFGFVICILLYTNVLNRRDA